MPAQYVDPYATGGGGVTLERRFGAFVMGSMLAAVPVYGIGDGRLVSSIWFQSGVDNVDDVGLKLLPDDGLPNVRMHIGVRRNPRLLGSNEKFVKLLQSYVREIAENTAAIDTGELLLGLAVAAPHGPGTVARRLSDMARSHTWLTFWAEVDNDLLDDADHDRLSHLATALGKAQARLGGDNRRLNQIVVDLSNAALRELTWRFLFALRVMQVQLEGDHPEDRTQMVAHLSRLTASGEIADKLYGHLELDAGRYAISRGVVNEHVMRRDLRGRFRLSRSPRLTPAWSEFDRLADTVASRTRRNLSQGNSELHLSREAELAALAALCREVSVGSQTLVVTGEPDVGKSALVMEVVEGLRRDGGEVITLNLRDLPPNVLDWEMRLRARLKDVLALSAVDTIRALVVDGAEAVLEKHRLIAEDLCRHALNAGLGVVLVARIDAADAVRKVGVAAALAAGMPANAREPRRLIVEPIAAPLIQRVVNHFPTLNMLVSTSRGRRVLSHVGLVDLILHADVASELYDSALSEVDILNAVWMKWIRCGEVQHDNGAMPDDRDNAVRMAAEDALYQRSVRPSNALAVASLRSDGVFAPVSTTVVGLGENPIADDLIRDLATAMIFIKAGSFGDLASASAPRTALRAARLAVQAMCQAIASDETLHASMAQTQKSFDTIATTHGARWSDVPWEALLQSPVAERALTICDSGLHQGEGLGRQQVLGVLKRRFIVSRACDPVTAAPAVVYFVNSWNSITVEGNECTAVAELVAAWLRGWTNLAAADRTADLQEVYLLVEEHLIRDKDDRNDLWLESIALLGPRPGTDAEGLLKSVATQRPQDLWACVERHPAVNALAEANLDLLLYLAEAYYIVPNEKDRLGRLLPNDDGIRGHHDIAWYGLPSFDPGYGPFYRLLQANFDKGVAFIGRLVAHATRHIPPPDSPYAPKSLAVPTFKASILGLGERAYHGDATNWQWHQGILGGPGPCTSALQALESFVGRYVKHGVPAEPLLNRIAAVATTAAELGLILNLVVRHTDRKSRDLDGFAATPQVWIFEHVRHTAWTIHRGQAKPEDQVRFGWDFINIVTTRLVLPAVSSDDAEAKERLGAVKEGLDSQLTRRSKSAGTGPENLFLGDDQYLRQARMLLDIALWRIESTDDGRQVAFNDALRSSGDPAIGQQLAQGNVAHGLEYKYTPGWLPPLNYGEPPRPAADELLADIDTVKALDRSQPFGPLDPLQPAVAVAAAASVALAEGRLAEAPLADWSLAEVLKAVAPSILEQRSELTSTTGDPHSAMASAAAALPHLLVVGSLSAEREAVAAALSVTMSDPVAEVRRISSWSTKVVWGAPCQGEPCLHQAAWKAVEAGIRTIQYDGPPATERTNNALMHEIQEADVSRVDLHLLVGSVIAAMLASRSESCVHDQASPVADALLQLYRNGLLYRDARFLREWETAAVSEQLLCLLESEMLSTAAPAETLFDECALARHIEATMSDGSVSTQILIDLAYIATYMADHRATLKAIWPKLMALHLDHLRGSQPGATKDETLLASIIPKPSPSPYRIEEFETTLAAARADWIPFDRMRPAVEEWIALARGLPTCASSLVGYLKTCTLAHQIDPGLDWVRHLIEADSSYFANQGGALADWLTELGANATLQAAQSQAVNVIIDLLAAAGDTDMLRLQRFYEK